VGPSETYSEIQPALDAAVAGDEIIVRDGTYTGPNNRELDFRGKGIILRSENGRDGCIIDCEYQGRGFFFHNGETAEAVVDGFMITRGFIVGDWYDGTGGGIRCEDSTPTIRNCAINYNYATRGGGIYCWHASPKISNCIVTGNIAEEYGGGILPFEAAPYIVNCTITGNTADQGGGVFFDYSAARIYDCIISNNTGVYSGGGIYCYYSSPEIKFCIINENSSTNDEGGGIYCYEGSPIIRGCTITKNRANDYGGGILCANNSSPNFSKCIISGNTARLHGGGIFCLNNSSPIMKNCIISGNGSNQYGGGIACDTSSSPYMVNCTFSGNTASLGGGGISSQNSSSPVIIDSIFWNDCAPAGTEIYVAGASALTISYSDIRYGQGAAYVGDACTLNWGDGNLDADPLFVGDGDYHLTPDSPCIDTGIDIDVCDDIDEDVRPVGNGFDMGADEAPEPPPPPPPPPPLTQVSLLGPNDLSNLSSPPTFSWSADGGTNDGFAVDFSLTSTFKQYRSTYNNLQQIIEETSWTMSPEIWNTVPTGKKIYWRVRGADRDVEPLAVIASEEVWSFTKQ
jgi:parallel beta-helix repeat protein